MSARKRLTISAPALSSRVACLIWQFAARQSDPRIFSQAPPLVGKIITPGPVHFPGPSLGCLQTKIMSPSVKLSCLDGLAESAFLIRVRLSKAAQARVAACRSSASLAN